MIIFILPRIADEHGFCHADGVFFEHEICRRPTDQREVIARMNIFAHGWTQIDTDFFTKTFKTADDVLQAYGLLCYSEWVL